MQYWLIKSEPANYSWNQFEQDGRTVWEGVRNYQARNNLRAMQTGDLALFYHSNDGKAVVGIARVVKEAYQDPTTTDANWVVVDMEPVQRFNKPVTLQQIKQDAQLGEVALLRQSRLSVMSLQATEFDPMVALGNPGEG